MLFRGGRLEDWLLEVVFAVDGEGVWEPFTEALGAAIDGVGTDETAAEDAGSTFTSVAIVKMVCVCGGEWVGCCRYPNDCFVFSGRSTRNPGWCISR